MSKTTHHEQLVAHYSSRNIKSFLSKPSTLFYGRQPLINGQSQNSSLAKETGHTFRLEGQK